MRYFVYFSSYLSFCTTIKKALRFLKAFFVCLIIMEKRLSCEIVELFLACTISHLYLCCFGRE